MPELPAAIRAYVDAFNACDLPAMLACLDDSIAFRNIMEGEVSFEATGKLAFADLAAGSLEVFTERHRQVLDAITVGEVTLMRTEFTARVSRDLPGGWVAGERVVLAGRSLYELRDGLILRIVDER